LGDGLHWEHLGNKKGGDVEWSMRNLWELDISTAICRQGWHSPQLQKGASTAMPSNLQAGMGYSLQLQMGARAKCSTAAFPKMFTSRE
jgi:hypothetical protein